MESDIACMHESESSIDIMVLEREGIAQCIEIPTTFSTGIRQHYY